MGLTGFHVGTFQAADMKGASGKTKSCIAKRILHRQPEGLGSAVHAAAIV
jgi:hypothetical protein